MKLFVNSHASVNYFQRKDAELPWDERQSATILPSIFAGSIVAGEIFHMVASHPKAAFSAFCGWESRSARRYVSLFSAHGKKGCTTESPIVTRSGVQA